LQQLSLIRELSLLAISMRSTFFAFVWLGLAALANAQDNAQLKIGGGTIDVSWRKH
jgi:hypothetical protein